MSKIGDKKINQIVNPSQYKVGAYIRTGRKIDNVNVIKFQQDRVQEFCNDMKLEIIDWYIDEGCDLSEENRPHYEKLIEDIKNKRINMIVTANLARIARSKQEMLKLLDLQKEYKFRTIFTDSREELYKDRTEIHLEDYIQIDITKEEQEYQEENENDYDY